MKKFAVLGVFAFWVMLLTEARTTIHNPQAGNLSKVLTQAQIDTCKEIVLTGELNSADLKILRRMAGYKEHEGDRVGRLAYLDLSGARFKSDKKPYLSVDAEKAHLCLYQQMVYPSPQDNFSKPSVRDGMYGSPIVSGTPYVMESSGYRDNFALLNLDDTAELGVSKSYRMTSKEKKGFQFKSMRQIKGHHLKNDNGQWVWSSYIRKGQFCYDMFYGCSNLKVVILPKTVICCDRVRVYHDEIAYYTN